MKPRKHIVIPGGVMKKIPTIFNRSYRAGIVRVINMQYPKCDWVFNGDGVATRKWDGTCCMIDGGDFFKRRCVKKGKPIPDEFDEESFDENTGKAFGWMPVTEDDKWHMEAFWPGMADGTYELVGPKVQGNVEKFATHTLIKHKRGHEYHGVLRTFDGIRDFMKDKDIEGIVFHRDNGQMAKIKKSDYGMERRPI